MSNRIRIFLLVSMICCFKSAIAMELAEPHADRLPRNIVRDLVVYNRNPEELISEMNIISAPEKNNQFQ